MSTLSTAIKFIEEIIKQQDYEWMNGQMQQQQKITDNKLRQIIIRDD